MTLLLAESLLANPVNATNVAKLVYARNDATASVAYSPYWTSTVPADATSTDLFSYASGTPPTPNNMERSIAFEWGTFATNATSGAATDALTDKILSAHSGGVNVCFCDGHQYYLNTSVDVTTFKLLMTPWGDGIPSGMRTGTYSRWNGSGTTYQAAIPTAIPAVGTILDEGNL